MPTIAPPEPRSSPPRRARGRARSSARGGARARPAPRGDRSCGHELAELVGPAGEQGVAPSPRELGDPRHRRPGPPRRRRRGGGGGRRGRPTTARRRRARRRRTAAAAAPESSGSQRAPAAKSMNRRVSCAWMKRSCGPAAIPRSSVSIASASRRQRRLARAAMRAPVASARRVAITIALDPPSPTSRGISVRTLPRAGTDSPLMRLKRAIAAAIRAPAPAASASGSSAPSVTRAPIPAIANPIVLPPKPSEGLPSSAARARASPRQARDRDLGSLVTACEDGSMPEPEETAPVEVEVEEVEVEAAGPGELGRSPGEVIAAATVSAPTRGNRRLEALLDGLNADAEVQAWWHMAQVQSERLGMSDHSWVHVRIVLNIALRLLRLLVKGGLAAGDGHRPRDARPRRRGRGRRGRAAARRRHVDPPRRPRGLQPLPRRAQAARAARRRLPRPGRARGRDRRVAARDHRPPPPRRALHGRGRASSGSPTRSTWPTAAPGCRSRPGRWGSTRSRRPRSTGSRSRPATSARCGSRSR